MKQEGILGATFELHILGVGKNNKLREREEGEEEALDNGRSLALLSEERVDGIHKCDNNPIDGKGKQDSQGG